MRLFTTSLAAGLFAATLASATTLTVDFKVTTDVTGGAPGTVANSSAPGRLAATAEGSITFDTSNAIGSLVAGVPTFTGAVTDIDFTVNSAKVELVGGETRNQTEQVPGPNNGDSLAMTVTDGFAATGLGYGVAEVFLDIRFNPDVDIFSDGGTTLLDDVVDGLTLNATDIDFFRLSVEYVGAGIQFSDSSIFPLFSFGTDGVGSNGEFINVTGAAPGATPSPVPLPAGMPLLVAGLGVFAVMRRRRH